MDSGFNGENVIHLIGGDESSNQVNKPLSLEEFEHPNTSFDANPDLTDEGDAFTMEIDRSRKTRLCKTFLAKGSCPFGDECVFIHDDVSRNRENTAILLVDARYRSVGPAPVAPPLAPLPSRPPVLLPPAMPPAKPPAVPIEQEGSNDTVKPINWRTRICRRWEQAGYCQYGSKCLFAHGVAELQKFGGPAANPNNQGATFPNVVAATRSLVGASGSSADGAAGSTQLPGRVQKRISKWPVKINGIYGDWIDDIE